MKRIFATLLFVAVLVGGGQTLAANAKASRTVKFRVTGLFRPDREADFREAVKAIPGVKLLALDYEKAEATFEFIPAKAFPDARKPEQVVEQLDNKVKSATNHTFGIHAARAIPRAKLKRVEIRVAGCHCKACDLAAYEAVAGLPGVERATACFREGRVTALIDPAKTDRAQLIAALKRREVDVKER